jgi:hypothetical protein
MSSRPNGAFLVAGLVSVSLVSIVAQQRPTAPADQPGRQAGADEGVPADLRPLLQPRQSELRLVVQYYNADRTTLSGNYQGASEGRGGGRGGPPAAATPALRLSLSPHRIGRLKQFDLDWKTALADIQPAKLSREGRTDLDGLRATIDRNLAQLEADARLLGELQPLVPFAPRIVALFEARMRIEDVHGQKAAAEVTTIGKEIGRIKALLESSSAGATGSVNAGGAAMELALRSADATDSLRASLTNWFTFFNGYDPLFTWWVGLPYRNVDRALQDYATFLRDKVATGNVSIPAPAAMATIAPPAAPKFAQVPNLSQLLALPQDEMTTIVQRFTGRGSSPGGGRGGDAAARGSEYYERWLAALKTLDFDGLSRNAQVDYLFIKTTSEMQLARAGMPPQKDIPRKADDTGITGAARGRMGLLHNLADERIPYTPEELIELGYKELAWLEGEIKRAAAEMGFGDDWKAAVEKVKDMHPPPGGQPAAIRDMLHEAVDYVRAHDMITVPQVAAESLRMIMMTPERQLINPFFTGGAQISVSYPTDTMEYEARIQSMRGNNVPFSHATAFHEMIPGHNLVGYIGQRYAGYRASLGGTPFYGEGWPLYWEIILYDKGFHDTPEERVGAMFWRMHRAARIIFSMNFHLGVWSPQECIDFLVDRVGHERDNATAEVRRSFQNAAPLYQAAYLLGGLQIHGLRKELVDSGNMTEKRFHDEVIRQGSMPIAFLRLALNGQRLTRDTPLAWRFYDDIARSSR